MSEALRKRIITAAVLAVALLAVLFLLPAAATVLVLKVLSILIAGAAMLLFIFRSPFPLPLKVLFVFSLLPLYEYAVMARNYGISMLLMFSFAALYPRRCICGAPVSGSP